MEDSILIDWEKSVKNFFLWIERICGIHKDDAIYEILQNKIETQQDLDYFVDVFNGDINDIGWTVARL